MTDSESSDDMAELNEILQEYAEKEKQLHLESIEKEEKLLKTKEENNPSTSSGPENQPKEWFKSDEEVRLEKLIFGDKAGLLENLKKSSKSCKSDEDTQQAKKRKPVWHDTDDDLKVGEVKRAPKHDAALDPIQTEKPYNEYLKSRFERLIAAPKWADLDREDEPDSDEEILRTVGFIDSIKSTELPPHDIQMKRMKDINRASFSEGPISSIQFHPTSTAAMVSGLNCSATIYSIDGLKNEKLHRIRFRSFPIKCAKILPCGTEAMFASNLKHYYTYDLMKATEMRHVLPIQIHTICSFEISPCGKFFASNGRFGEVHLFDLKSKELIKTFKQEDRSRTIKFSLDSSKIITSSVGSTVNIFDIRRQRLMHSFIDEGCIQGQSLALSPDGRMLATGSGEGAVNIYSYEKVFASNAPKPEKTILNLTTEITQLKFNHTSEILAMCSDKVRSAVKLVHFPTGTVFANFPGFKTNLNFIRTIEFSPSSGFLALGSKIKEASLYRLKHFTSY